MLTASSSDQRKIVRALDRVLVVDPAPAASRLLSDLLNHLGVRAITVEPNMRRALETARAENPSIIFTEFAGQAFDGLELTRMIRRSEMACRQAPVIMVTSEATAVAIVGARDAGVHEFLRKPYTIKDLTKRVEAVALRSRDWVEAVQYIGPDRRRFNSADYKGPRKRKSDAEATPEAAKINQALRILKSAILAIDSDPRQALRAIHAQSVELARASAATGDMKLAVAAGALQRCLAKAVETGAAVPRGDLELCVRDLVAFLPPDAEGKARTAA